LIFRELKCQLIIKYNFWCLMDKTHFITFNFYPDTAVHVHVLYADHPFPQVPSPGEYQRTSQAAAMDWAYLVRPCGDRNHCGHHRMVSWLVHKEEK